MLNFKKPFGIVLVCFLLFVSTVAQAQNIISAAEYDYPNFNSTESTIATASINPVGGSSWSTLRIRTQDRRVAGFKHSVKMRFFDSSRRCNPNKKRLVILLTGLGSEASSGQANYYANIFVKECMSVLIVPSVFTKDFSIAASRSGVVGDRVEDMKDLYTLLVKAVKVLRKSKRLEFSSYSMFGYSLGALSAGFVSEIDYHKKKFNFKSVLMANSPVDLMYGMRTIDKYASYENQISRFERVGITSFWVSNVLTHRVLKTNLKNYSAFVKRMDALSELERKSIVGKFLKGSLHDIVLTSQDVLIADHGKDLGVLPPKRNMSSRAKEADSYDFSDYIKEILALYQKRFTAGHRLTEKSLNASNSLYAMEAYLKKSSHIYMMHTRDDFLLRPKDEKYLAKVFKDRLFFYPRGGHCGNLWFEPNLKVILNILTK